MLFDLRGRGRRRTIQVIYAGLAVLMGGGLVLFGVGTGGGGGGLLNAFNPNGGSSAAKALVSQQTKTAEKQVKLNPTSAQAWATLTQARYTDAGQGVNTTTGTYSASGKADLALAGQAWQQYLKLAKKPDSTLATIMAKAYQNIADYTQEAQAWQIVAGASPKVAIYWYYVASSAYLAKNATLGNLAAAKALALAPKAQRVALQQQLNAAKSQAGIATTPATKTATAPTPTVTAPTPIVTAPTTTTTTPKPKRKK